MNFDPKVIFDKALTFIFGTILLFLVLGIAIGVIQLFANLWQLLRFEGITGHYLGVITDVVTLFVFIELSRSLVDYFSTHRLPK